MAPAPEPISFNMNMIGPTLIAFGSEAQKRHFLPRIARMDYWFCQGFSEPGCRLRPGGPAHQRGPRRRPLRRQRPEALDLDRPPCRLVLPARAHRPGGEEAAGHHLPADGHEVAGRHDPPDRHDRRPPRDQRDVPGQRAHSGGEARGRREQGLGLRQVPARPRAQRHRARRRVQVPRAPRQAAGRAGACRRAGR